MKRVTIKDVADEAGVSVTTVSHVINETRYVNPETKLKVQNAQKKLSYRPNSVARSLRMGITKTIGLIVPDASNLFFAEVARKIEDFGYQQGYSVILGNSDNDPYKQANYVTTLIAKQVDGVIFISAGGNVQDLQELIKNNIPVVLADRDAPVDLVDVVLLDNEKAGYDATQHLLHLGHERIACITGPNDLSPSMLRVEGYKRALNEWGIPFRSELIKAGDFRFKSGESTMRELLKLSIRPTAAFILNDMMAIGAMTAARKEGVSVPSELSIVGFDDIEFASAVTPALTTLAQPFTKLAESATNLLIERMQGEATREKKRIILDAQLVVRESTCQRGSINV